MTVKSSDPRRATAERNIAAILDAAEALLHGGEPASISAVATRAGVSRVTVYAHFSTREAMLRAVVERTVSRATVAFDDAASGNGSAAEALERGISASWFELSRNTAIAEAAAGLLSPDVLRTTHEAAHRHVLTLLDRGRQRGEFRTDVPVDWLLSIFHSLLHAAGDDVRAGRMDDDVALHALTTTMRAAFAPPGEPTPAESALPSSER